MTCQHGWTLETLPARRAAARAVLERCEAAGVAVEPARACLDHIDTWAQEHGTGPEVSVSVIIETGEMLVTTSVGKECYDCSSNR